MLESFILSQFISALLTTLIGIGLLFVIRKRTQKNIKENRPAGLWVRAICFGTDLAIIDIVSAFLAFRGSLEASGYITITITLSYFFFFWLFFAATPAMMLARIRILSKEGNTLKIWQVLTRLGMLVFLIVGWIPMLFDKKEKRALQDIVAKTRVAYSDMEVKMEKGLIEKLKFVMVGMVVVLLIGLIVHGFGEKITKYTQNSQMTFFDLNKDGIPEGLTMDTDADGKVETFKYDLDNDHVVDFTTFDADKDGIAESIDINNDGRIDGFDFDNDNILDIQVSQGQFFIWLWRILLGVWIAGFASLLIFGILKERRSVKKHE